jgi:predicted amino acid racemase
MAFLNLYKDRLEHNFNFLKQLFQSHNMEWGVVSKLLCGNKEYLKVLIELGITEMHDSRIKNLKMIKNIKPDIQTVLIKPAGIRNVEKVIRYADVSMNTDYHTIKLLSDETVRQRKMHKVIIMIETGDLREGVMGEQLVDFYAKVFDLPGIEIIGIGTNLNCLHGVMPSQDKLIQMCLYKQIIELKFNKQIPWVSAGTSVTIPLLLTKQIPKGVNHFRIGETLFFGVNLFEERTIEGMYPDVFELYAEIIEITRKPRLPTGELGTNPQGKKLEIDPSLYGKSSYRAILDVGLLDVSPQYLRPIDPELEVLGASSDMLIVDLGEEQPEYKVGDLVAFRLQYMGTLQAISSDYIDKKVVLQRNKEEPVNAE